MYIKLVTKIKTDGNLCRKSARVLNELESLDLLHRIDEIISADERQATSEGFTLANKYQVQSAPFFIVEDDGLIRLYTAYYQFMKDVFQVSISEEDEISEIIARNPELDYI
ncbi:hypothetical protein [Brunnivagina elsteri]|uniref:Thioredoxin family protein n=1 Tax=Brunnivagina elsteri CCALA 953 TaxID=987040 RepID=A0A2A2TAK4_9CYAN|nr:hypothetical protein [Calothrix elsteri]PAX46950.1 hypothetical protein CK510_28990 [Calothrix elsteri CCALA 953]